MTDLIATQLTLPSAAIGPENPLPPLAGDASLAKTADLTAASETIARNAAYGRVTTISPYLLQDGYTRDRSPRQHPATVLQNEHLRATVLPGLGGRLYSLIDRASGRELLYANPILQPANLALRSAWFAGGVEWNIGTIGHTPLTCAPLHAARVVADDGTPVLRLYEFERLRGLVYQLDFHLPGRSRTLYVHVRVTNRSGADVPMYWWSNIAVPQRLGTRVIAPADHAWNYSYDNILRHDPVAPGGQYDDPLDISYPARYADAADFFFDLDPGKRPWIAAVDEAGDGLFQTSTAQLTGRKLFRWGTSAGGRRWQEWLSGPLADPAGGYAEIQAGLAATQFEHVAMPARAVWSWTEGYGAIGLDPATAHGSWRQARGAAEQAVTAAVPDAELARIDDAARLLADRPPAEILASGSGWGAFERTLRRRSGRPEPDLPSAPFGEDTLGPEQQPWLTLLETGEFPEPADGFPASVHLSPQIVQALETSAGWAAAALLGVARASAGQWAEATAAWQESLRRADNPYAHRNLAVAATVAGDHAAAARHYLRAWELVPPLANAAARRALAVETVVALLRAGATDQALALIDHLPQELRALGRMRMLTARAALAAGQLDRCAEILDDPRLEVADLREGEESLDELYLDCQVALAARQRGVAADAALRAEIEHTAVIPAHLDFRMKPAGDGAA